MSLAAHAVPGGPVRRPRDAAGRRASIDHGFPGGSAAATAAATPPPAPHDAPSRRQKAPTKPPSPEKPARTTARSAPKSPLRQTKTPPKSVPTFVASRDPAPSPGHGPGRLSELQGAATAGSGSGGGGRRRGLRHGPAAAGGPAQDPAPALSLIRAHGATVGAGRAPLVWSGDWQRTTGEEGDGLAGLREMIMMEVAFAPAACRAEPMRGLVLISLNDGPGPAPASPWAAAIGGGRTCCSPRARGGAGARSCEDHHVKAARRRDGGGVASQRDLLTLDDFEPGRGGSPDIVVAHGRSGPRAAGPSRPRPARW
ncbi:hypothetical protein ACRAWD_04825 [Caulobacter segnis]